MSETNIKRTGSKSSNTVSGEIMESVVKVEKWQYDAFLSRLKALNKKAEIFGLQPIEILTREDVMYQRIFEAEGSYGDKISVRLEPVAPDELAVNPVAVTVMKIGYPIIKLGNWYVVGKLEAVEGGNLMFSITDDDQDKNTLSYKALSRSRVSTAILRENARMVFCCVTWKVANTSKLEKTACRILQALILGLHCF